MNSLRLVLLISLLTFGIPTVPVWAQEEPVGELSEEDMIFEDEGEESSSSDIEKEDTDEELELEADEAEPSAPVVKSEAEPLPKATEEKGIDKPVSEPDAPEIEEKEEDLQFNVAPVNKENQPLVDEAKKGVQGNWYEKREWLIKAKDENQKIQEISSEMPTIRKPLRERFDEMQQKLDVFYEQVGRTQVQLENLKTDYEDKAKDARSLEAEIKAQLTPEKASEISWYDKFLNFTSSAYDYIRGVKKDDSMKKLELTEAIFDEKSYEEKVIQVRKEVDILDKEIGLVKELDEALVKRMKVIDDKIANALNISKEAEILYNEIWEIIDHINARENFYKVKGLAAQIESIKSYLEGEFSADYNTTLDTTSKQIDKVNKKASSITDELKLNTKQVQEIATEKAIQAFKEEEKPSGTIWGKVVSFGGNTWNFIENIFSTVADYSSALFEKVSTYLESNFRTKDGEVITKAVSIDPPKVTEKSEIEAPIIKPEQVQESPKSVAPPSSGEIAPTSVETPAPVEKGVSPDTEAQTSTEIQ